MVVAEHREHDVVAAEQGVLDPLVADPGDGAERVVTGLRADQLVQGAGDAVPIGAEGQPDLLLAIGRDGQLEVPARVVAAVTPAQGDGAGRQPEVGRVEVHRVEGRRAWGPDADDAGDAVERRHGGRGVDVVLALLLDDPLQCHGPSSSHLRPPARLRSVDGICHHRQVLGGEGDPVRVDVVQASPWAAAGLERLLGPEERDRLARLRREADRAGYATAHALLRLVAAAWTGRAPDALGAGCDVPDLRRSTRQAAPRGRRPGGAREPVAVGGRGGRGGRDAARPGGRRRGGRCPPWSSRGSTRWRWPPASGAPWPTSPSAAGRAAARCSGPARRRC